MSPVCFSQLFLADNPTILLQETLDENQVGGEDTSSDGNSPTPPPIWKGWRSMSRSAQIKAQVNFESMVNEIEIDKSKLKREKTNVCFCYFIINLIKLSTDEIFVIF